MTTDIENKDLLRAKINQETSRMPWSELLRFFASGAVVAVGNELDLVEVAVSIASDDKEAVARWMADGHIGKVSDAQASAWLEEDAALWTAVVKPWVLVQREKPSR